MMLTTPLSIAVVFFRTTTLAHLDAALYSLARQNLEGVSQIIVLDNNTPEFTDHIELIISRYFPNDRRVLFMYDKHGDLTRTHSWSVNTVVRACKSPWVFFTRSDYILSFDCLHRMRCLAEHMVTAKSQRPFVSGYCWQMAYDEHLSNTDAHIDIERYHWRERGMAGLLQHTYAVRFHSTHLDAGVWLTQKAAIEEVGGMNEHMVSWGYQQSSFQRALQKRAGVTCDVVKDYLFAHQHHAAPRNFETAHREFVKFGGGV